jgi:undecaprenyl-diphosphatase
MASLADLASLAEPAAPAAVLLNHRRALRLSAAALALGGVMLVLVGVDATRRGVQVVDDSFLDLMVSLHATPADWVAKAFAFTGGVWVNWPLRVVASVMLAVERRWLQLAAFVLAVVTSEALIGSLKALYDRPRPPHSLIGTSGASFPSGHAMAGAVTAIGLVLVLLPPGRRRWAWELRAALFAVLMAASRTYLRAHWLSDVVAGGLLGTGIALGWPALLQELRDGWLPRRRAARATRAAEAGAGGL